MVSQKRRRFEIKQKRKRYLERKKFAEFGKVVEKEYSTLNKQILIIELSLMNLTSRGADTFSTRNI